MRLELDFNLLGSIRYISRLIATFVLKIPIFFVTMSTRNSGGRGKFQWDH